ncbi:MAG: hypothetical protein ISP32_04635 [Thermoleophilia bacterium]|nr:hypothetical protein [Thermoleophilia bacterium]
MDVDRLVSLTAAAALAGCSRKSLERRVERGSLPMVIDPQGRRAVRVADLLRAGLVAVMPAGAEAGADPRRVAEAEAEADALRAALAATESALARSRGEVQMLRQRVMDAEARAAVAEDDLTRVLMDAAAPARAARGRRARLRPATA